LFVQCLITRKKDLTKKVLCFTLTMVTRISSSAIALVIWTSSGRHTHSAVVTRMSIAKMVRLKKKETQNISTYSYIILHCTHKGLDLDANDDDTE